MKIFLDTANLSAIENAKKTGLIDGITTNPTHLSKEGGDSLDLLKKICALMAPADVSIEVTEKEPDKIYQQAQKISLIAPNVVVKIPCTIEYAPIIKKLVEEGIAINMTLLFSANQGLLMAKLGVKYISPYVGRLDDIESNGIKLIYDLKKILSNYNFKTQLLAASLRTPVHFHEAALAGADCATIPPLLFETLLTHPLTTKGIGLFDEDWQKLGIKKFPQ